MNSQSLDLEVEKYSSVLVQFL